MAAKIEDMTGQQRTMDEILAQLEDLKSGEKPSHTGGGGGNGMIERIVQLEAGLAHVQKDVTDLRVDMKDVRDRLKGLEVKVDHLPSKGFIVAALVAMLALIAALIGFQDQVQNLMIGPPPG
tara:strand:+ start:53733 stop:54098 length:366 start_codon:yes stop_codon:yes gene_type:complete